VEEGYDVVRAVLTLFSSINTCGYMQLPMHPEAMSGFPVILMTEWNQRCLQRSTDTQLADKRAAGRRGMTPAARGQALRPGICSSLSSFAGSSPARLIVCSSR
jgi:hypothetical protein